MSRRLPALLMLALVAAPLAAAEVPLDPSVIATLPRVSANGNVHGHRLDCEGVSLTALLQATGAMPQEPLSGARMSQVVVVDARDGYRAVFALAELDPSLGNRSVVLSDRCNGAALGKDDGPWRLVVPGESRPARWVRQVESIRVVDAP